MLPEELSDVKMNVRDPAGARYEGKVCYSPKTFWA